MAGDVSLELLSGSKFPAGGVPVVDGSEPTAVIEQQDVAAATVSPDAPEQASGEIAQAEASVAAKGKKAKKTAGKSVAVSNAYEGELLNDEIVKIVKSVEALDQEQVRLNLQAKQTTEGFMEFEIGALLQRVSENGWYTQWGFPSFKAYVEEEHGIGLRKAYYLVSIFTGVLAAKLTGDQVKSIGWTKLRYLLNPTAPLLTAENVNEWVEKCQTMSATQLLELIEQNKKQGQLTSDVGAENPTTKVTFKLHADQLDNVKLALQKAKEIASTDVDAVALDCIASDFIGNSAKPTLAGDTDGEAGAEHYMKTIGWEKTLMVFEKLWPEISLTVEPGG